MPDDEKIGYLPRPLTLDGSPGSDPEDGDLIYFIPWGNLGFYYNAAGIGYSDQTLHIGSYEASLEHSRGLRGLSPSKSPPEAGSRIQRPRSLGDTTTPVPARTLPAIPQDGDIE